MESKYLFCNSKIRPIKCKMKTNLCCLICQFNTECFKLHKLEKLKVIPCRPEDEEEENACEYKI